MKQINLLLTLLFAFSINVVSQNSQTFNFTGSTQFFIVPSFTDSIMADVRGAEGARDGGNLGIPGKGGKVQASIPVTAGDTLFIFVGGTGLSPQGGYNGGGNGGTTNTGPYGGGGGGASDIRQGGSTASNRIMVAGGGGGCGGYTGVNGGDGGGLIAQQGDSGAAIGGGPGTQISAGNGGNGAGNCGFAGMSGVNDVGGAGGNVTCGNGFGGGGGGGGGYYGGGGGGSAASLFCCPDWSAGGGGGSSYTGLSLSGIIHTPGFQTGNGLVIFTWNGNTGYAENKKNNFYISVSPNPLENMALIKFANPQNDLISICLTDLAGRKVKKDAIAGSQFILNACTFEKGIYLLHVQNKNSFEEKTTILIKY